MTPEEHFERHFDDNRVITKECDECEQDDILTTVKYLVMNDEEEGKDETKEQNLCNNCIESLRRNKSIYVL